MANNRERGFAVPSAHSPFHRELARQNVEGVSLLNVSLKRLPFKERYFFLFDDYLLEVSLPTRSGKYKFVRCVSHGGLDRPQHHHTQPHTHTRTTAHAHAHNRIRAIVF
jgi:hypothetical protein